LPISKRHIGVVVTFVLKRQIF